MKRGDVYWVSFDPSVGGEMQKTRPAIILSNDAANVVLNRVLVVPITSKTERVFPGEALITLNGERRKAMADQLTTASKLRLGKRMGAISLADTGKVEQAVLLQLGIRL